MQFRTEGLASLGLNHGRLAILALAGWMSCLAPLGADEGVWRTDLDAARQDAAERHRPLLIELTATWCTACRQMQQLTLIDSRVIRAIESGCVAVTVDVDQHPEVVSEYRVEAFPTTLLLDSSGKVQKRWVGFQPAGEFAAELERLTSRGGAGNADASDRYRAVSAAYPANASPSAFGGYCLVSLLEDKKLRRGSEEVTTAYRGQTVCFASAEHRTRFLRDPLRYWPVANGTCVVTKNESHSEEPGDPRVGVTWRGRLWFFADRDRQQRFIRSPSRFGLDRL